MDWNNINSVLNRTNTEETICNLLLSFDKYYNDINFKKGFYIYGTPGSGKTKFVEKLLTKMDYDIVKYDASDIRNKNLIETINSNNISNYNVLDMMKNKKKKIAIVMDEIDGMNSGDKGGIAALIKLIRQKKTKKQKLESITLNPIFCIGNHLYDKKIRELMKVCNVFELKTPTNEECKYFLRNMISNEKLYNPFCNFIQGDLRKIELLVRIQSSNKDLLNESFLHNVLHAKCNNENAKNITALLFKEKYNLEQHNNFINENDRTIVSLLWHENVIDHIELNKYKNQHNLYIKFLDIICYADYVDRITFQNQIWQFNEMSSLIKSFYCNKIYHDNFNNSNMKIMDEIRFTKVLTKYSTEYNNQLFIFNLSQQMNMDKKDMLSFFQEFRLHVGDDVHEKVNIIENIFESLTINKLDVKRIFRFLDKNVKKETETLLLD
jgi:SpoVK/Ycf46/Vps4 family AAA+-type ATPase